MTGRPALLLAGVSAACFLAAGCSSGHSTPAASAAASASSAAATPAGSASARAVSACYKRTAASGAILVRLTEPGRDAATRRASGGWTWNAASGKCVTAVQAAVATAPHGTGDCTRVAYASANPGYKVSAVPSAPLKRVTASAGPAC